MGSKLSFEKIERWLIDNNLSTQFKILEYSGDILTKSKFLELERNFEFELAFHIFRQKIKKNKNYRPLAPGERRADRIKQSFMNRFGVPSFFSSEEGQKKAREGQIKKYGGLGFELVKNLDKIIVSKEEVETWLEINCPKIICLKYSGRATTLSTFKDLERSLEFKQQFYELRKRWEKDPTIIFCGTQEELKLKRESTCTRKWNAKSFLGSEESIKQRTKLINGKSRKKWAQEKDVSVSTIDSIIKNSGVNSIEDYKKENTDIDEVYFK